jgi:hypothetical protein
MSVSRHHADWLSLVESSGPFVSLPVLLRAFPQGLDPRDPEQAKQLRFAYEEWQQNPTLAGRQRAWIICVLTQALGYPQELLAEGQSIPPGLSATMAEYGETLRPDSALVGPAGGELAGKPQLLITIYAPEQSLEKPVSGKHWKAAPATRMMELLHATDVALGLVTNGDQWMLVYAPRGETTGFTSWYAGLWIDEPITLRAFQSLLGVRRFFGVAVSDTLLALLRESAQDQQEVTNQLGDQVRDAVEVLIQAFDRLDQDSGRILLRGFDENSLYDAALTVMMRLVFLFSAEERDLLHLGKPMYDDNYAVSTLREQLQEVADRYGEEVLERRNDAWARLLATFRAVHGGVRHQDLMLPAYGGSLFDPDRYPFLEGRPQGSAWLTKPAEPLAINNRVVLHLLKSLQVLQVRVPGGGPAEARRISFRALDIEQIGHIYEGLLDHTAVRAREVVLGLAASRKKPVPSITLSELETLRQQGETKLVERLEELTERSAKALEKALKNGNAPEDFHRITIACNQDQKLAERVRPFVGLLRQDSFERLVIVLLDGIYVGQGVARRSTGTHYTPRSLTEPIVQRTLEPLVYTGPAEGLQKEQWRLKSPREILDLKVCDMTMGSGAFLVQVCRYLSERLVEAWENLEREHPDEVLITPEGEFSRGEPSERLIPKEAAERVAIARRIIADRCIYGVDINPMAVEMAKLSIWLITVDKTRPFTFLDHALKCGDSLLGISQFKQLEIFSLHDSGGKQVIILSNYDELIRTAIARRRELEKLPSNDAKQIAAKMALNAEAEERLTQLKLAGDLLVAAELTENSNQKREMARAAAHMKASQFVRGSIAEFRHFAKDQLQGRRTLHWPLEFPEVFQKGGFDAFIGNPPYMHGSRISTTFGDEYAEFLRHVTPDAVGKIDLAVYFLRRATSETKDGSTVGLVVTSKIKEGAARTAGYGSLLSDGWSIYAAISDLPWPGTAGVIVSCVSLIRRNWEGARLLNGKTVSSIDSRLEANEGELSITPLVENDSTLYLGAKPDSLGFTLSPAEAQAILSEHPNYSAVIRPYFSGTDINECADLQAPRSIIDFSGMSLDAAAAYPELLQIVEREVKPSRIKLKRDSYKERWWQFTEPQIALFQSIRRFSEVLAMCRVSKHFALRLVPTMAVYSDSTVIFVRYTMNDFAVLSSSIHNSWAVQFGGTHGSGTPEYKTYKPATCGLSYPFPTFTAAAELAGRAYYDARQQVMRANAGGLTATYNRLHDPREKSPAIIHLRVLRSDLDRAVADAYGWCDLELAHGFHETRQGVRFTLSESARRAVLDRLLTLNHQRYELEVAAGLQKTNRASKQTHRVSSSSHPQPDLLDMTK